MRRTGNAAAGGAEQQPCRRQQQQQQEFQQLPAQPECARLGATAAAEAAAAAGRPRPNGRRHVQSGVRRWAAVPRRHAPHAGTAAGVLPRPPDDDDARAAGADGPDADDAAEPDADARPWHRTATDAARTVPAAAKHGLRQQCHAAAR